MTSFHSALLFLLASATAVDAFAPPQPLQRQQRCQTTRLYDEKAKEKEKMLRQEIADRNSIVQDEGKYAVADGERLSVGFDQPSNATEPVAAETVAVEEAVEAAVEETESVEDVVKESKPAPAKETALQAKIKRMTKERAYPLFLAEKAAEIVEDTVGKIVAKTFFPATESTMELELNGEPPKKERIVILGTGWGAASFLKDIDATMFDVTVISPRNHFVFTPMLAGASVGTVEYRSITEPVREINRKASFLEATAKEVDSKNRIITCESVICDGNSCEIDEFTVEYDRLIVTVGAQTNTFGIPGVREHCNFLKQVEDARRIRTAIVNCFERANLPNLTEEERRNNLTFGVIGAGPTGIEFAAELRDFVEQDGPKYYPKLLKDVRIKVIEASSTVLAPFDKSLQEEAIAQMNRDIQIKDPEVKELLPERFKLVELLLDSSVKEVTEKTIFLNDGTELRYGLAVWAAGNGPLPLTLQVIGELGDEQSATQDTARGRISVDPWMRAIGSKGSILAFGDCSCSIHNQLPATAQVASQQGEYLAKLMNKKYDFSPPENEDGEFLPPTKPEGASRGSFSDAIANLATASNGEYAKPFQFLNLGILAYTGGGSALAQVATAPNAEPIKGKGKIGNALWRSVYLSKQVSWRNRLLVLNDWTKRQLFGRDITRL